MQRVALGWLVYRLTDSAFLLGLVGFAGQLPSFLFAPIAGVLVDRLDRHRLLLYTQVAAMAQALSLAILVLTDRIAMWHIMLLSILLGFINTLDLTVRQSFLIQMIDRKEDLSNAIALNSSMVNGARMIGPSFAGILITWVGEGFCFLINGISYIAVIAALLMMQLRASPIPHRNNRLFHDLAEGFGYVSGFAPIRAILLLLSLVSLMGMSYVVLMPVFAKDILQGGPLLFGNMMTAAGIGALIGALSLAFRQSVIGLGKWIGGAAGMMGIGLILTALSREIWLSILLITVVGFAMMVQMAASNTILQTIVDETKRGRVMSFYTMALIGMAPFGSLIAGALAAKFGAPTALIIGGLCCLIGAIVFSSRLPALRMKVRPIYEKLGIIPNIASAIHPKATSIRSE